MTIQAQILDLIRSLVKDFNTALIMITHDLGVVAEMAEKMAVMYAGRIVEQGTVVEIFNQPMHPYTAGLMNSILTWTAARNSVCIRLKVLYLIYRHCPWAALLLIVCEYARDNCHFERPSLSGPLMVGK